MRKTRSDSRLSQLTAVQKSKLVGWMRDNLSLEEITAKVQTEFGIQTSRTAVSTYCGKLGVQVAVATAADDSTVEASGFEILITSKTPGRLSLAIRPLPPATSAKTEPPGTLEA